MGSKIWRLGTLASVHVDLREVALPYMEDVYELGNDAVQIAVLDGLRCLVVDRIAGSRTMSVLSKPGSRLPLHATGVGKVLLAFGGQELQDAVLGSLDRYTHQTITDADLLRSQLRAIHPRASRMTHEELAAGATSVAVPLRGKGDEVIAALGIVSLERQRPRSAMVPVLQVTAAALSKQARRRPGWVRRPGCTTARPAESILPLSGIRPSAPPPMRVGLRRTSAPARGFKGEPWRASSEAPPAPRWTSSTG